MRNVPFEMMTNGLEIDDEAINMICDDIQYKIYPANCSIIKQGEIGTEMFIIISGEASV